MVYVYLGFLEICVQRYGIYDCAAEAITENVCLNAVIFGRAEMFYCPYISNFILGNRRSFEISQKNGICNEFTFAAFVKLSLWVLGCFYPLRGLEMF